MHVGLHKDLKRVTTGCKIIFYFYPLAVDNFSSQEHDVLG